MIRWKRTCLAAITAGGLFFSVSLSEGYEVAAEKQEPVLVPPVSAQTFRSNQCHYTRDQNRVSSINCGKALNSGPYKKEEGYVTFGKGLCTLSIWQGQVICSKLLFKSGRGTLKPHHLPG